MSIIPPPPGEPTCGRSCEGGHDPRNGCHAPSIGWRYFPVPGKWLPTCAAYMGGMALPRRFRVYDDDLGSES